MINSGYMATASIVAIETKGGGGILAYFHSNIPSKKLKLPKRYKTIEAIAVEGRLGSLDIIFIGIYRPPKVASLRGEQQYLEKGEEELNDICMWASVLKQTIVITGDLNLDRLRPDRREEKILLDLEEVHDLHGLITTPTSETLLDVIMTTKPSLFKQYGSVNPEISDHYLVYGILTQSVFQNRRKVISFRSLKNVDIDLLNKDLMTAPWEVGEIFDTSDDQYDFWSEENESARQGRAIHDFRVENSIRQKRK